MILEERKMVQKLEDIRGGGGSIRIGTIGTISSLMTREIEALSSSSSATSKPRLSVEEASSSGTATSIKHVNTEVVGRTKGQNQHRISVISASTPKRQKQKAPLEDVGNSSIGRATERRSMDFSGKTRTHKRSSHIPMLGSENTHLERTPIREKSMRKGSNLAHVVDIHCGSTTGSLSNRLKKLGFSKLSHSFM